MFLLTTHKKAVDASYATASVQVPQIKKVAEATFLIRQILTPCSRAWAV